MFLRLFTTRLKAIQNLIWFTIHTRMRGILIIPIVNLEDEIKLFPDKQGGMYRVFNTVNLLYKDNHILFGGKATTRINGFCYF